MRKTGQGARRDRDPTPGISVSAQLAARQVVRAHRHAVQKLLLTGNFPERKQAKNRSRRSSQCVQYRILRDQPFRDESPHPYGVFDQGRLVEKPGANQQRIDHSRKTPSHTDTAGPGEKRGGIGIHALSPEVLPQRPKGADSDTPVFRIFPPDRMHSGEENRNSRPPGVKRTAESPNAMSLQDWSEVEAHPSRSLSVPNRPPRDQGRDSACTDNPFGAVQGYPAGRWSLRTSAAEWHEPHVAGREAGPDELQ